VRGAGAADWLQSSAVRDAEVALEAASAELAEAVERSTAAQRRREGALGPALQAERDAVVSFHSDPVGLSATVADLRARAGVLL